MSGRALVVGAGPNGLAAAIALAEGELKDDAAALCLDWHGGAPRERTTDSGADA